MTQIDDWYRRKMLRDPRYAIAHAWVTVRDFVNVKILGRPDPYPSPPKK
jgi:hypothetical protein